MTLSLTQGGLTLKDGYWLELRSFCWVHCENLVCHQGPLLHCFASGNFIFNLCMGSLKQNVWIKLENDFKKEGRVFGIGNVNWCMLGRVCLCYTRHFCVEPGFFCWTMHFAVDLGFYVSNECYNYIIISAIYSHTMWPKRMHWDRLFVCIAKVI